ncbi:hypothetical protein [Streptomyces goshikiensis]|uniref:hypothetical protein n=1 Tax=Streptomyces goshikiensis TaxID=1942 RepID=UPI0036540A9F
MARRPAPPPPGRPRHHHGPEDPDGNFTPLFPPLADQTQNAIAAATTWWRKNHLHLPLWPFSLDSAAFAPAITATRNAL